MSLTTIETEYYQAIKNAKNLINLHGEKIANLINENLLLEKNINYLAQVYHGKDITFISAEYTKNKEIILNYKFTNQKNARTYYMPSGEVGQYILEHSLTFNFLFQYNF
jgi:hypothetical protein